MQVQTSDKTTVLVTRNAHNGAGEDVYGPGKYACITGTVQAGDLAVRELQCESFGTAFDLDAFGAVLRAKSSYPQVF